jgi:hypothetical protein
MARTLTIELPDELEQKLVAQARHLNISLETLVAQTILFWLAAEAHSAPSAIAPNGTGNDSPTAQTHELPAQDDLSSLMAQLREAHLAGAETIQIPANPVSLEWLDILKALGLIADVNPSTVPDHLNIVLDPAQSTTPLDEAIAQLSLLRKFQPASLSPQLAIVVQELKSANPAVRQSALKELGAQYHAAQG